MFTKSIKAPVATTCEDTDKDIFTRECLDGFCNDIQTRNIMILDEFKSGEVIGRVVAASVVNDMLIATCSILPEYDITGKYLTVGFSCNKDGSAFVEGVRTITSGRLWCLGTTRQPVDTTLTLIEEQLR